MKNLKEAKKSCYELAYYLADDGMQAKLLVNVLRQIELAFKDEEEKQIKEMLAVFVDGLKYGNFMEYL